MVKACLCAISVCDWWWNLLLHNLLHNILCHFYCSFKKKLKPSTINANEWRGKVDNLILKIVSFFPFFFCWFEKNVDAYCKKKVKHNHHKKKSKNIYVVWFNYYKLAKIRLVIFFLCPFFVFILFHSMFSETIGCCLQCDYILVYIILSVFTDFFVVLLLVSLFAFVLTPFR